MIVSFIRFASATTTAVVAVAIMNFAAETHQLVFGYTLAVGLFVSAAFTIGEAFK